MIGSVDSMLTQYSQRDPRIANTPVGTSTSLFKSIGCTVTCIGIKYGVDPLIVNELMNAVDGFAPSNPNDPYHPEKNLVIWAKIAEALPGTTFSARYNTYDDNIVRANLPCLVEVNAAPIGGTRHWVVYIGGGQLIDPWDGQIKATSAYQALGFVVLGGEYGESVKVVQTHQASSLSGTYQGLDLNNLSSVKAAVDTWKAVVDGQYVSRTKYDSDLNALKTEEHILQDPHYTEMKLMGYNTVDDVNKALRTKDDANLALIKEIAEVRNKNSQLAAIVERGESEDHTAVELAEKALSQNKELNDTLLQIAKISDAPTAKPQQIVSSVSNMKEANNRLLNMFEAAKAANVGESMKNVVSKVTQPFTISSLLDLLQISSKGKEVTENNG